MSRPNFLGLVAALFFLSASLTPSLIPRDAVFQTIVSGLVVAIGYGIGTLVSHAWRSLPTPEPPPGVKRIAWLLLAVGAVVGVTLAWFFGARNQQRLHLIMGMRPPTIWVYLLAVVAGLLVAVVLVLLGRGVRLTARRIGRFLARWLPRRVAGILGGLVVTLLLIGLLDGFVVDRFFEAADETFLVSDLIIPDDAEQPLSPLRSGSPDSLVAWEDLGSKGRTFVSGGPDPDALSEFWSGPALEPIRVYAGLASADQLDNRLDLVSKELERTGAFEREVLCVVTATGTGRVNPQAVAALEYLWAGDTATVAVQYSYLPSWISFLVDSARAREAGEELFNRVYEIWNSLPEDERPRLVVFGESLGADGSEAAFSGVADLRNRTDGVLWAGPPNFSELWSSFTADRDEGTPEHLPVYEGGETVRFAGSPGDLRRMEGSWPPPRVLYLQNASDPVVWWSPRLILRRPDWLVESPGDDVLPVMRWFPLVTFLQITADLANSIDVPPGHGHNYASLFADGWVAVASPEGWDTTETERLRLILAAEAEAQMTAAVTS